MTVASRASASSRGCWLVARIPPTGSPPRAMQTALPSGPTSGASSLDHLNLEVCDQRLATGRCSGERDRVGACGRDADVGREVPWLQLARSQRRWRLTSESQGDGGTRHRQLGALAVEEGHMQLVVARLARVEVDLDRRPAGEMNGVDGRQARDAIHVDDL